MRKNKKSIEMEKCLKTQGFRMTLPRRVILDFLSKTDEHLLAKDIYLKINKNHPDIGLTTVYRTLDLLVKLSLINKFEFGEGQSRYELTWDLKEHHHHLFCLKCGKIIDYNDFIDDEVKFFTKIQKFLSKKYKFNIQNHEVHFYGKCNQCHELLH
ncbi:MAG: transcriptional repressor [Candidatus Aminicenantes bacterium]|nr:transcriptional repressor [Candidatus Aminicenantes bacterium]